MRRGSLGALALAALLTVTAPASACVRLARRAAPTPTPALSLDSVFASPSGQYTIRYNRSWRVQQVVTQAGVIDFFTLPDATLAVVTDHVLPGTNLEGLVQSTISQYQTVHIQGLQRAGSVNVGGGRGELLHATTYVNAQGATVATPPEPGAKPRNLYQAFYLAGEQSFTFSIAWPQNDKTDYLSLFRSMLQTFTLSGAS